MVIVLLSSFYLLKSKFMLIADELLPISIFVKIIYVYKIKFRIPFR